MDKEQVKQLQTDLWTSTTRPGKAPPQPLTLEGFLRTALEPCSVGLLKGQKFSNDLIFFRRDLFIAMPGEIDPYYRDELLWAAVDFVIKNWDTVQSSTSK